MEMFNYCLNIRQATKEPEILGFVAQINLLGILSGYLRHILFVNVRHGGLCWGER